MRLAIVFFVILLFPLAARAQFGISGSSEIRTVDGDTTQVALTYWNWDTVSRQITISAYLMEPPADSLRIFLVPPSWTIQSVPGGRGSHGIQPAQSSGGFGICGQGQGRTGGVVSSSVGGYNYLFYVTTVRKPGIRLEVDHNITLGTPDSTAVLTVSNVRSDTQWCILSVQSPSGASFRLRRDTIIAPPHTVVTDTIEYSTAISRPQTGVIYCHSHSVVGDSVQSVTLTGQRSLGVHVGALTFQELDSVEVFIDTLTTLAVRLTNRYSEPITLTSVSTMPYTSWFGWLRDPLGKVLPDSSVVLHIVRYYDILRSYPPRPMLDVQFGVGYMFDDSMTTDRTVKLPTHFRPFNSGVTSFFGGVQEPLHFVYCTPYSSTSWDWSLYNSSVGTFFVDSVFIPDPHFTVHSYNPVVFPHDTLRIHATIGGEIGNYYSSLEIKGHFVARDTTFYIPVGFGLAKAVAGVSSDAEAAPRIVLDPNNRTLRLQECERCTVRMSDILGHTVEVIVPNTEPVTLPLMRPLFIHAQGIARGRSFDITQLIP